MPEDSPSGEDKVEEVPKKNLSKATPVNSPPGEYDIEELLSLSEQLPEGIERHMAAGALRHANIDRSGRMTVKEFTKVCQDFLKVKAF